ncbi:MAG: NUDIX hydrolase [Candidatus Moranbacteria bacterium]|jgi:ADP-ribose pyrophosphatase YjhB (NUDIX family)|nr:NUDIX hydrolase [Candidatus Moranbacteria bacterium]MDD5652313.1 NUDIX hydrolase [Candidatus Moranbacteria bacterium]MDX9856061.1 NUDIX hydrolase [Candidatus Moranbacteria bacterium]
MVKMWRAARTVIFDKEGKTAVIEVKGGAFYKVPGGWIAPGEGMREAALRKAREEAGCKIEILSKLGDYEFVGPDKRRYRSVFYLARKVKEDKDLNFDDWARSNKFKLMWVGYDEALQLFKKARSKDVYESDINRRDLTFLKKGWDKYIGAKK